MMLSLCRAVAALAMASSSTMAVAQIIPPTDLPGRERERFIEPPAARAQPRGPVVTLPSTVAPQGAETVKLVISAVRVTGSTVYGDADLAPRSGHPVRPAVSPAGGAR